MVVNYVKLGSTGMDVSRICLGALSFGEVGRGEHRWTLDLDDARPMMLHALESGVNFVDTGNVYSAGSSEEIVGRILGEYGHRDEIVLATKVHGRTRPGPNGVGLSRKAIMTEIDNSLRRLGTDHVDLYQVHRWDPATPIETTMRALHDVVTAGKARHIGASSMWAWQFAKAQHVAERNGWTPFSTMQNHYNLIYREEEREMLPLCADQNIGVIPWSPLARGRLARPWDTVSARSETDTFGKVLYVDSDREIVDRLGQLAAKRGLPMAQLALAWLLAKPEVTAPIVGATSMRHLDDAIAALDVELDEKEITYLEELYEPHRVAGHPITEHPGQH
jgi:1-deoxyxylulose-5-phosphate synthase